MQTMTEARGDFFRTLRQKNSLFRHEIKLFLEDFLAESDRFLPQRDPLSEQIDNRLTNWPTLLRKQQNALESLLTVLRKYDNLINSFESTERRLSEVTAQIKQMEQAIQRQQESNGTSDLDTGTLKTTQTELASQLDDCNTEIIEIDFSGYQLLNTAAALQIFSLEPRLSVVRTERRDIFETLKGLLPGIQFDSETLINLLEQHKVQLMCLLGEIEVRLAVRQIREELLQQSPELYCMLVSAVTHSRAALQEGLSGRVDPEQTRRAMIEIYYALASYVHHFEGLEPYALMDLASIYPLLLAMDGIHEDFSALHLHQAIMFNITVCLAPYKKSLNKIAYPDVESVEARDCAQIVLPLYNSIYDADGTFIPGLEERPILLRRFSGIRFALNDAISGLEDITSPIALQSKETLIQLKPLLDRSTGQPTPLFPLAEENRFSLLNFFRYFHEFISGFNKTIDTNVSDERDLNADVVFTQFVENPRDREGIERMLAMLENFKQLLREDELRDTPTITFLLHFLFFQLNEHRYESENFMRVASINPSFWMLISSITEISPSLPATLGSHGNLHKLYLIARQNVIDFDVERIGVENIDVNRCRVYCRARGYLLTHRPRIELFPEEDGHQHPQTHPGMTVANYSKNLKQLETLLINYPEREQPPLSLLSELAEGWTICFNLSKNPENRRRACAWSFANIGRVIAQNLPTEEEIHHAKECALRLFRDLTTHSVEQPEDASPAEMAVPIRTTIDELFREFLDSDGSESIFKKNPVANLLLFAWHETCILPLLKPLIEILRKKEDERELPPTHNLAPILNLLMLAEKSLFRKSDRILFNRRQIRRSAIDLLCQDRQKCLVAVMNHIADPHIQEQIMTQVTAVSVDGDLTAPFEEMLSRTQSFLASLHRPTLLGEDTPFMKTILRFSGHLILSQRVESSMNSQLRKRLIDTILSAAIDVIAKLEHVYKSEAADSDSINSFAKLVDNVVCYFMSRFILTGSNSEKGFNEYFDEYRQLSRRGNFLGAERDTREPTSAASASASFRHFTPNRIPDRDNPNTLFETFWKASSELEEHLHPPSNSQRCSLQ